jgi:epoxyqueuosine reductase
MGNRGNVTHIPSLARALCEDTEPLVRRHAAWALGRFVGSDAARAALDSARLSEADPDVVREIDAARNELVRRVEPAEVN